jgi:hypothetical protein
MPGGQSTPTQVAEMIRNMRFKPFFRRFVRNLPRRKMQKSAGAVEILR